MGTLFQHRLSFWERVTRCHHPQPCAQCCWPWYGATDAWGYGRTSRTLYGKHETYAHRIAWILTHGRLPQPGSHPTQTCALPACCNPSHLQERTAAEIQQASVRTGRRSTHPHARKLTPALVAQIRQARAATPRPSQRHLAAQFGITQSLVHAMLHEQIWRPNSEESPMPRQAQGSEPYQNLSVRVPKAMVAAIDAYLLHLRHTHPSFRIERGDAVRDLVRKGFDAVQAAGGPALLVDETATAATPMADSPGHAAETPTAPSATTRRTRAKHPGEQS